MYFKKHLLLPLSASLIALLTLAPMAEAMHSVASQDDAASSRHARSQHSVAPASVVGAAAASTVRAGGRISKADMTLPERTPILQQKLFRPWNNEWHNLSLKNARHLARDSLARLVDHRNPLHQAGLDLVISHMEISGGALFLVAEDPAERFQVARERLREGVNNLPKDRALHMARLFQNFWNRQVERAEALALEKTDRALQSEVMAAARAEFSNPELFPLWREEERTLVLNMYEAWGKPITSKELMGRILLERGRGCMSHCLRHPTLGPRLFEEIVAVQARKRLNALLSLGHLEEFEEAFQKYALSLVFPKDALAVTHENQNKALKLLKQARSSSEVLVLRSSIYGPPLMSLEAAEMDMADVSGEPLARLVHLLPNLGHLTCGWGPHVRMTSKVIEEGVIPLMQGRPKTLTHITFRHDLPEEFRARVQENTPEGLEVTWEAHETETVSPSDAELQEDQALLRTLVVEEMRRWFSPDPRSSDEIGESSQEEAAVSGGISTMGDLLSILEGPYVSGSQHVYGTLQALVREAEAAGQDLGLLDLSSLRPVLNASAWHYYHSREYARFIPWYLVYGEDEGILMNGPEYVPPIPLEGEADIENVVVDVPALGLGEGLQDVYTHIRAKGAGPKLSEYNMLYYDGQLLQPVGLA